MTRFHVIDSDTHVDETDATWDYLDRRVARPIHGRFDDPSAPGDYWLIDGHKLHKAKRSDAQTKTTATTRELLDVGARLADMDVLGVDVQVIYPTLFLKSAATRAEVAVELATSYNRWLADRTAASSGRLRWVCILPFSDQSRSLEELRVAKDHGACGILKKGDVEAGFPVWHDHFFPLYDEAQRLDMPICFHQGSGRFTTSDGSGSTPESDFIDLKAPAINGISAIVNREIPAQFPDLRWGCLEVGASWAAMVQHMYERRLATRARTKGLPPPGPSTPVLASSNVYATCELDEDFATILPYLDEDHLLVGSDYTHNDPSQDHGFIPRLHALVAHGVLSPAAPRKIMWDNPKVFYGL